MITIPNEVFTKYIAYLLKTGVPVASHGEYKKWLRRYLDFCDKYPVPESKSERVRLFTDKLQDKKQSLALRQRAANAVSLYYQMEKQETREVHESSSSFGGDGPHENDSVKQNPLLVETAGAYRRPQTIGQALTEVPPQQFRTLARTSNYNEAGYQEKSDSPEWDTALSAMADEIMVRHY